MHSSDQQSQSETLEALLALPANTQVRIKALTRPHLTGNAKGHEVLKETELDAVIHGNYQDAVNNERVREGLIPDFVSKPLSQGTYLKPGKTVILKDNTPYVGVILKKVLSSKFVYKGREIAKDRIAPFLKKYSRVSRQWLRRPVIYLRYRLEDILSREVIDSETRRPMPLDQRLLRV